MKNTWKTVGVGLISMLVLTGCATDSAIPEMSIKELQMVEEYAAHLLLKYDENYKETRLTQEAYEEERARIERLAAVELQIEQERAARKEEEAAQQSAETSGESEGQSSGGSTEKEPVYTDIDDFFGIEGVEIEYKGYVLCDSYPENLSENDWQGTVHATGGNSLLVFEYELQNVSGEDVYVDMSQYGSRFTFRIDNSFSKASMMTMLLNDLSLYRDTIAAGESATAVLVVELTQAQAQGVNSLTMIMRYGDERGELTLL